MAEDGDACGDIWNISGYNDGDDVLRLKGNALHEISFVETLDKKLFIDAGFCDMYGIWRIPSGIDEDGDGPLFCHELWRGRQAWAVLWHISADV